MPAESVLAVRIPESLPGLTVMGVSNGPMNLWARFTATYAALKIHCSLRRGRSEQ